MAQLGGLARRATAIAELRAAGDGVVLAHNGGVIEGPGWQQELKLETALAAMQASGYVAMNVGVGEAAMGISYLGRQSDKSGLPLLAGNLRWDGVEISDGIEYWRGRGSVLGVVGLMSEENARRAQTFRPELTWSDLVSRARELVREAAPGSDSLVLLYCASVDDAAALARQVPGFDVIVGQSRVDTDVSPGFAVSEGATRIITPGTKGRYLVTAPLGGGGVRALPMADTYAEDAAAGGLIELYHSMVEQLGPRLLTDSAAASDPAQGVAFTGSMECSRCHMDDYAIWQHTRHAHAHETLVPKGRARDPECLTCHVVGLGKPTGFDVASPAKQVSDVGCEACHGPGGVHNANPELPYPVAQDCVSCHTSATSPAFNRDSYWTKITHGKENL